VQASTRTSTCCDGDYEKTPRRPLLQLLRATGLRVGELLDLELDCLVDSASHGTWLRVPLGKLASERMVPLDEHTLAILGSSDRLLTDCSLLGISSRDRACKRVDKMPSDSPLSQISQVQDMVARGKERGFITTEEVIEALAPVDLSAEQIDNVYQVLADENIEVVEMVDELDASGRPAAVPARLRQCRRGPG
jgi:hypothetical protein